MLAGARSILPFTSVCLSALHSSSVHSIIPLRSGRITSSSTRPVERQNRSDTNASTAASSVVVFPGSLAVVRSACRAVRFPSLRPPLRFRLRSPGSGTVRRSRADVASLHSATSRFAVTTLRPPLRSLAEAASSRHRPYRAHARPMRSLPACLRSASPLRRLPVGAQSAPKHPHYGQQAPAEHGGQVRGRRTVPAVHCPHSWRSITAFSQPAIKQRTETIVRRKSFPGGL